MTPSPPPLQRMLDAYDGFTRGERRLADFLLETPDALAVSSASEIAARAGVSKATAARFFRRLGYASFKVAKRDAVGLRGAPARAAAQGAIGRDPVRLDLAQHLAAEVQNLVRSVEQLRSDELAQAAHILARADKLWVVGFGDNYPLAHFARALLIRVRADIRMIPLGGFPIPEEFASIHASDAMLAFGAGRRARGLRAIMRSAIGAGARVVYVTDQANRAGAEAATVTLRARSRGVGVFDSMTAAVSIVTYLCSSLAAVSGEPAIERMRAIEAIHDEWGDLLPGDI